MPVNTKCCAEGSDAGNLESGQKLNGETIIETLHEYELII